MTRCCRTIGPTRRSSGSTPHGHTEPLELPSELVALLDLAKRVHGASDGCFDPTVRPLVRAWGFDGDSPAVPTAAAIDAARATRRPRQARASRRHARTKSRRRRSRSTWPASAKATRPAGSPSCSSGMGARRISPRSAARSWHAERSPTAPRGASASRTPQRRAARPGAANAAGHTHCRHHERLVPPVPRSRRPTLRPHHRSAQRLARRARAVVGHGRRPRRRDGGRLGHGAAVLGPRRLPRPRPSAKTLPPCFGSGATASRPSEHSRAFASEWRELLDEPRGR